LFSFKFRKLGLECFYQFPHFRGSYLGRFAVAVDGQISQSVRSKLGKPCCSIYWVIVPPTMAMKAAQKDIQQVEPPKTCPLAFGDDMAWMGVVARDMLAAPLAGVPVPDANYLPA
jgi:hypothetical protein